MKKCFFIMVLLLMFACSDRKANYELQERCGKTAAEYFNQNYSGIGFLKQSHYNHRLNKCLLYAEYTIGTEDHPIYVESLFDVNENKRYAYFTKYIAVGSGAVEYMDGKGKALTPEALEGEHQKWNAYVRSIMKG